MRAALKSLAAGGLLVLLLAAPAAAQYGSPSTTAASSNTTTPQPVQERASVDNPTPAPGQTVSVTGPTTITRQDQVSVVIAPAESGQAKLQPVISLVDLPGGGVSVQFTIPAGTPSGVYLIAVNVVRPDGTTRTLIVPITVPRVDASGGDFSAVSFDELPDAPALPARTKAAAASIAAIGGAEAVEKAVLEDGATLRLEGEQLALSFPDESAAGAADVDNTRPLTAAAALAAAGGGLVLLRRRQVPSTRGIRR